MDIIGRVAFGHDFQSGQSPEAKLITDSWNKDVNMGLSYAGFLAPFVIGMFPFIASSIGEGVTKGVVSRLAGVILEREEKQGGGKEEVNGHGARCGRSGKDILSLLMQAKRRNNGQGLSNRQIADNVSRDSPSSGTLSLTRPSRCVTGCHIHVSPCSFSFSVHILIVLPSHYRHSVWSATRHPQLLVRTRIFISSAWLISVLNSDLDSPRPRQGPDHSNQASARNR